MSKSKNKVEDLVQKEPYVDPEGFEHAPAEAPAPEPAPAKVPAWKMAVLALIEQRITKCAGGHKLDHGELFKLRSEVEALKG